MAMLRAKHPEADAMIARWMESCDFQTTIEILTNLRNFLRASHVDKLFNLTEREGRFQVFLELAEKRHGSDVFHGVFAHQDKQFAIVRQRQFVDDPEQRFFLALLLNVEGRERIYSLIKQRFPDAEPIEKVLDWTYDLANSRIAGEEKATALGLPDFGDIDLYVLEQILNGRSGGEIETAFRTDHGEPTAAHALAEKEDRIRNAAIFQPLLA